jgi:hypothetical protein
VSSPLRGRTGATNLGLKSALLQQRCLRTMLRFSMGCYSLPIVVGRQSTAPRALLHFCQHCDLRFFNLKTKLEIVMSDTWCLSASKFLHINKKYVLEQDPRGVL